MAILDILYYPDPRLRQIAAPVEHVDGETKRLIDNMAETMYQAPGVGLAAVQVNVPKRIVVIDISETKDELKVFINPHIIQREGQIEIDEGCLSVPGVYAPVKRAQRIRVRAIDRESKEFELEAVGLLGVCIQHEVDHLSGKMFVDYLSRLKQDRIRKRLQKEQRRAPNQPPLPASVIAL
ncbi:MAG: peptide deformylase [Gammaproteobacteria bacterium]|nr:peptide deformylase [Gammaproteobacteria bacterium]